MMSSCGFLDKEPDLRAEINSKKKVQLLLVSGYEGANYGPVGEFLSDNIVDNNSMDAAGHVNKKVPFNQMYDQLFAFQPVTAYSGQDSPYYIWQFSYKNIAVANQALIAIEKILKENSNEDLTVEIAEAKLIRAFNHFLLVNIFCKPFKNWEDSKNDVGVYYMTKAETTVKPEYDRGNVAETYRLIKEDLEAALPYIADDYYSVPKYHFNQKAAYAFAARFYLFIREYDKVIEYADRAIGKGTAASAVMFDVNEAKNYGNIEEEMYYWYNASLPANLMITSTYSFAMYSFIGDYCRYTFNRDPRDFTITGGSGSVVPGPSWDQFTPNFWRFDANFGGFFAKLYEPFEYTDKVAGIGYPHSLRREFTTGETLLCRAEAKVMTGDLEGAVSDMNVWSKGWGCSNLTADKITKFFYKGKVDYYKYDDEEGNVVRNHQHCPELHNSELSANWTITDEQLPYIWCVLHMRRVETLHDGMRYFDIKRYGITITHKFGYPATYYTMSLEKDNYAVELPQEAIEAGQKPNYAATGDGNSMVSPVGMQTVSALEYKLLNKNLSKK